MKIEFEFTDEMVAACEQATAREGLKGEDAVARVVQGAIAPLHRTYCIQKALAPAQDALNAVIDKARADEEQARASFKAVLDKAKTDADAAFEQAVA